MTDEINEFSAYISSQNYTATNKRDTTYLGRFTFKNLTNFEGLGRVLTIIARGHLFNDSNKNPYNQIDYARNALCAWCSMPEKGEKQSSQKVDFRELSSDFQELVNEKGEGFLFRHVHNIIRFVKKTPNLVSVNASNTCNILTKRFNREWKKKVKQLQVPIFALNTKGAWVLRFDDIIADALVLGALRNTEIAFTLEELQQFKTTTPKGVPDNVIPTLIAYYRANKSVDSDWVVLPVSNFDAYFGNTGFSKKWLNQIPNEIMERQKQSFGVCRYRIIKAQNSLQPNSK